MPRCNRCSNRRQRAVLRRAVAPLLPRSGKGGAPIGTVDHWGRELPPAPGCFVIEILSHFKAPARPSDGERVLCANSPSGGGSSPECRVLPTRPAPACRRKTLPILSSSSSRWGGSRRRLAPTTTVLSGQGPSLTRRRNRHNGGVTVRETPRLPLRQSGSVVTTGWCYPSVVGDGLIRASTARGLCVRTPRRAPAATPHHTGQRPCEFTGRGFWREPGGWFRS